MFAYMHTWQGFYQAALGIYDHIMDNETFKDLVIAKVRKKIVLFYAYALW